MFDFIRNHSRLMLGLMVLLIFPSFVFFGVQGYSRFTDPASATVAKVDGQAITRAELEAAHRRRGEQLRRQMPDIDAALLESASVKRATLDELVRERVLFAAANDLHLFPDDRRLQRLFATDPQFEALRNADGSVNKDLLAAQGLSSQMLATQLRQQYGMQQVLGGVVRSAFEPAAAASAALGALLERREVQWQRFDPASYRKGIEPDAARLEAYYRAHLGEFAAPEEAQIDYVVLDADALAADITVAEDEVRRYYEQNPALYTTPEERRARHILVKAEKDAPATERQQAKARAEALLAELRKDPSKFAELARRHSQDPGSAERGGDLDYFGRGAMVKPFEDAVYALKPGQLSGVVETDFGYHVIQLTDVRGGQKKPFEAVRAEIETQLRKELAAKQFSESAEQFTDIVFEQPDSLQPVIEKFKLKMQHASVTRTPAAGASGPLASAKLLAAVFSPDALAKRHNTEAVEFGPNRLVSARVTAHTPARTLPLEEVRERVRDAVIAEEAARAARSDGEAMLAKLKAQPDTPLPMQQVLSRAQRQEQPQAVVDAALRADATRLPGVVGVDLGSEGYVVLRVVKVLPRELPPEAESGLRSQLVRAWGDAEARAYLEALKARYKVEIREPALASFTAASAPGS